MKETTSSNETGARFTTKGMALTVFILAAYLGTWLPHFGIFNSLTWIGPLTLPMAWIYSMNVLTTIGVILIYKLYFKPFAERHERETGGAR